MPESPPEVRPVFIVLVPGEDGTTTHRICQALSNDGVFHEQRRNEAALASANESMPAAVRQQCANTAAYHTGELYAIGALLERFGRRNPWPAPAVPRTTP